ncbi:MAG TPA: DUF4412 domain-containing protein [Puia sp.]|uniref:DUF4412 domain-containing protein n=1 Tax=Puia sp. TaxID=2045100 RepID=UPI002BCC0E90|nr:DUF4412 domain-containing protein [Puia sp.]HVU94810.1 DUF4412 domain-containing protein [Puia sp.]
MKPILHLTILFFCAFIIQSCQSGSSANSSSGANADIRASGSGSDTYLEYTSVTTGKRMSANMLMKMYISHTGKLRNEMYMATGGGKPSLLMEGIADENNPTQSILIDDSAKTYSVHKNDTSVTNQDDNILTKHTTYIVNKIGNETIQGLNCVHGQIIKTTNLSGVQSFLNGTDTTDIWSTKDIPIPAALVKGFSKSMGIAYTGGVADKLVQMDCVGFPVRFQMHGKDASMLMNLTKISHDNFPTSLFAVPAGYKQTEGM